MITDAERQIVVDEEHLRLLPVFYWVQGGVMAMYAPFALIYVVMGASIALEPSAASGPGEAFGWMFAAIGVVAFIFVAVIAVLTILSGFWIRKRKHRTACMVIAGITCLGVPYGTMIGVFTFIVLLRPSVARLFGTRIDDSEIPSTPPAPPAYPVTDAGNL